MNLIFFNLIEDNTMKNVNQNDVKDSFEKISDNLADSYSKAKDQTKAYSKQFEKQIKESPWKSALLIGGIAFLLGKLL